MIAFAGGLATSATPCVLADDSGSPSASSARKKPSRGRRSGALRHVRARNGALVPRASAWVPRSRGRSSGACCRTSSSSGSSSSCSWRLAASMFGAFEMALPSSLNNRLASVGGIGFGGAFVLGLVTSSTSMSRRRAPARCSAAYSSSTSRASTPSRSGTAMMFSFAGRPRRAVLPLVGTFAVNLPKGGAWMLGIKWIFGVALSVFALYFLPPRAVPRAHERRAP